jgi:hypothetical protein
MARRRQQTAPTLPDRQLQAAEAWYEAMLQKAAARGFPVAPSDGVAAPCSIVELARTPFSCSGTLWTTFGRPRSGQGGCRMTRPPRAGPDVDGRARSPARAHGRGPRPLQRPHGPKLLTEGERDGAVDALPAPRGPPFECRGPVGDRPRRAGPSLPSEVNRSRTSMRTSGWSSTARPSNSSTQTRRSFESPAMRGANCRGGRPHASRPPLR